MAMGVSAFVTPSVFYFTSVLLMSVLMLVPAMSVGMLAGTFVVGSLGALSYMISIGGHKQWRESTVSEAFNSALLRLVD
jgi:hypothetical protein